MNPARQRLALARIEGYRIKTNARATYVYPPGTLTGTGYRGTTEQSPEIVALLPDYLHDAEAMRRVFAALPAASRITYGRHLQTIMGEGLVGYIPSYPEDFAAVARIANVPAAQLAEATLRTVGQWEESEITRPSLHTPAE